MHFFFPRVNTNLRFNIVGTINNAGFLYANNRYRPTNAYDVDPSLGSTSMPGFAELAGIYRRYRVNAATVKISFSNNETFSVGIHLCPDNSDPGSNTSGFQKFLSNPDCQNLVVGPSTGNSVGRLSSTEYVSSFGGSSTREKIDDNYSGDTSGTNPPPNNIYWYVGIVSAVNLVSGVYFNIDCDVNLDFYELTTPAT